MTHSDQIDQIAAALSDAQDEIEDAEKDASNPFFKSKYCTLAAVRAVVRKPFAKHGLSYVQPPSTTDDGKIVVTTLLMHESGQWIRDALMLNPKDDGPQALGSVISYGRRYYTKCE
ncbi:MAG TPA: ERF family protein [Candidatus Paceibacterota bacterium]